MVNLKKKKKKRSIRSQKKCCKILTKESILSIKNLFQIITCCSGHRLYLQTFINHIYNKYLNAFLQYNWKLGIKKNESKNLTRC